ncbi:trigger factor [Anaerolineales bacterium HSG6]|nr:trigger factor [Anaerolineales bacterium HSG6]MDM8530950.1 trigger factor [Anaerolineales bacterium HSG25]
MEIIKDELERCETLVTATFGKKEVEKLYKKAARKLSRGYKIPGFRPGKAPYQIVARRLGIDTLHEQILQEDGERLYTKVIQASEITPYGQANVDEITWEPEPLVIKIRIPTAPTVTVGNYRDIRIEPEAIEPVTDEEIQEILVQYQEQNATWVPSEKLAEEGDSASILVTERDGDTVITDDESGDYVLILSETAEENPTPQDKFTEALMGLSEGDEKEFTITYPEDFNDSKHAGKTITFHVEVSGVKVKELDPIDDELAQSVSDLDTLDALKTHLQTNIEQQRENERDVALGNKTLLEAVKLSEASWSVAFEDQTLQQRLKEQEQQLKQSSLRFEDYYKIQNTTKEAWEEKVRASVVTELKSGLVLGEISRQENITVSEQELMTQIRLVAQSMQLGESGWEQLMKSPQVQDNIKFNLLSNKVINFLAQVAKGEVPAKDDEIANEVIAEVEADDTSVAEEAVAEGTETDTTDEASADTVETEAVAEDAETDAADDGATDENTDTPNSEKDAE